MLNDPEFIRHKEEIEREMHQVWMPHLGQLEIVSAMLLQWLIGVFVRCARKFGKTELTIYLMYMFALLFENSEIYYVADEKDHARDILWDNGRLPYFLTTFKQNKGEDFEDFKTRRKKGLQLHKKWIDGNPNNSEMKIKFKNGSVIKVDGAKNYSKADGLSPTLVVYDEFKDHDRRYDERMRPNLKAVKGRICIIGTASHEEESYYYDVEDEFKNRKGYASYIKPCYENPHVYDGPDDPELKAEEAAYRARGEYHIFAREYLSQIVPDTKRAIFPMFNDADHVGSYREMLLAIKRTRKEWDFYISFDPSSSAFGVLLVAINRIDKRFWLMDEIVEIEAKETTTKHIYPRAEKLMMEIHPDQDIWTEYYDHAEKWFQLEVAQEFDRHLHPCTKDTNNKEDSLSTIKDAMIYGRFKMSDRCIETRNEYKQYKRDDKGKIPKGNGVKDHNIDNTRYIKNGAYYFSVPRIPLKEESDKRGYRPQDDTNRIEKMETLLGGNDGMDYDNGY